MYKCSQIKFTYMQNTYGPKPKETCGWYQQSSAQSRRRQHSHVIFTGPGCLWDVGRFQHTCTCQGRESTPRYVAPALSRPTPSREIIGAKRVIQPSPWFQTEGVACTLCTFGPWRVWLPPVYPLCRIEISASFTNIQEGKFLRTINSFFFFGFVYSFMVVYSPRTQEDVQDFNVFQCELVLYKTIMYHSKIHYLN